MDENPLLAMLISIIKRGRNLEEQATADLSSAQRIAVGTATALSPKDAIAHISAWKGVLGHNLANSRRGEHIRAIEDVDAYNADLFNIYQNYTWSEIESFANAATRDFIRELRHFSRTELATPGVFPWLRQNSIATRAATTCVWHALSHISELYTERGNHEAAIGVLYEAMNLLASVDNEPHWQGALRYNIACSFTLQAYRDEALTLLKEAFQLNPALKEWALQDRDLESLRDDSTFQTLLG